MYANINFSFIQYVDPVTNLHFCGMISIIDKVIPSYIFQAFPIFCRMGSSYIKLFEISPELNRTHLDPLALDVKSADSIKVAIKKIARPFQSAIHARRNYRKISMLIHMNHENIIGLLDIFSPSQT